MENEITRKTIAMRNGTEKMRRDREYWSEEERKKLRILFAQGMSINEIAIELERSESAVFQQILQMGLYTRRPEVARTRRPAVKEPVCLCSVCLCDPALCPSCDHSQVIQEDM